MEVKELRIGNLVDLFGSIATIQRHDFNETQPKGIAIDSGKPIPLTEEWLIKLGLEKSKQPNGTIFYGQRSIFFRITKHPNRNDIFHLFGYEFTVVLEYVHQLQNLYFTLTGEELIIS